MSDLLEKRHQIQRKQPDERRALYAVIDAKLMTRIDEVVPRQQRSKFVESVLRREIGELQAS
ncbi:MAG: hypothetical protein VW829_09390 [Deltaproteobacteria bacterium]|jgi:Asp-tRNA(Asn)/Glu-tRNA(Gln) amidotransferase C subunit